MIAPVLLPSGPAITKQLPQFAEIRDGACGKNNGHPFKNQSASSRGAQLGTGPHQLQLRAPANKIICFGVTVLPRGHLLVESGRASLLEYPSGAKAMMTNCASRTAAGLVCVMMSVAAAAQQSPVNSPLLDHLAGSGYCAEPLPGERPRMT